MEGKEEDVRVRANKFPERQPIGTSAQTDKDYVVEPGELSSWSFWRAGIREFIATFLFLYITVLTVMGVMRAPNMCAFVGIQGIAWAFGGMIFALVYCTAGISASRRVMNTPVLVLVLVLVHTLGASSLTIQSPDGDLIDCIDRDNQPAFRNPLLKNHIIQEPPMSELPYMVQKETDYSWQVWHQNGTKCPEGSIPCAVGRMQSQRKIYGTEATMSVWHPKIEGAEEFSLRQIWLMSGSYNNNDINSIEAGWQVYPKLYHDYQPRFFIYWTTDAYNQTGGYNLRTGGFVQTSRTIAVEGAIAQTSIFGGIQVEVTIRMWKDQKLGSWWLGVILDGVLEPVGYWPAFLFTLQVDYATKVEWGGEIINTNPFGRHTTTQMGISGYFPNNGLGKVAYMRNLKIALSENNFQPLQDLEVGATHPDYYCAKKLNSTHFYYGGPEQLKSIAVDLTFDYILLYLSFTLFLLI